MIMVRLGAVTGLLTFCSVYPCLPGGYDRLAVPLSLVAQALVLAVLVFVPIGTLWLLDRARQGASRKRKSSTPAHDLYYARASVLGYVVVATVGTLVAGVSGGLAFACGVLALAVYTFSKLPRLFRPPIRPNIVNSSATPLALTALPIVALVLQVALADPGSDFSRDRAIANSAPLIADIEQYRARHGRFPTSLHAVWPDYKVAVVGIERFHYAAYGDTFNLSFEQPFAAD